MVRIHLDDDFYLKEATVYGLVSELPDYRLCYHLNVNLNLKLTRNTKDRQQNRKGKPYYYSEFSFQQPIREICWNLTSNKSFGEPEIDPSQALQSGLQTSLIPELKSFDYFLWYEDDSDNQIELLLNQRLKNLPYVRAFKKVDTAGTKNINNLLLEY